MLYFTALYIHRGLLPSPCSAGYWGLCGWENIWLILQMRLLVGLLVGLKLTKHRVFRTSIGWKNSTCLYVPAGVGVGDGGDKKREAEGAMILEPLKSADPHCLAHTCPYLWPASAGWRTITGTVVKTKDRPPYINICHDGDNLELYILVFPSWMIGTSAWSTHV